MSLEWNTNLIQSLIDLLFSKGFKTQNAQKSILSRDQPSGTNTSFDGRCSNRLWRNALSGTNLGSGPTEGLQDSQYGAERDDDGIWNKTRLMYLWNHHGLTCGEALVLCFRGHTTNNYMLLSCRSFLLSIYRYHIYTRSGRWKFDGPLSEHFQREGKICRTVHTYFIWDG